MNKKYNNGLARIKTYHGVENRKDALRGADFVVNAIQVGLYDPCTIIDFEIPKKYGLRQTIADTLGIGGIFRALRTIPVLADFAKDTGGKNIKIDIGSDNSIDKEQILQAYALITLSDISTDFILNTELCIFSTLDVGFIKHLSRLIFFVVLMVLASIGQFGRPDKKSLILNILLGSVAFVVVSIISGVIFNVVNKAEIYNASLIFCGGFFVVCQGMILVFTSSQGDDCLNV